jgi:hypothetical protein
LNNPAPQFFLTATAAFAIMGALGAILGRQFQRPAWNRAASHLGWIGACLCSAVLTIQLTLADESSANVHVRLWKFLSLQQPRELSMVFGLQANGLTAVLVSVIGGLFFLSDLLRNRTQEQSLSAEIRMVSTMLYAAITIFLLSPNLSQSLLSWCAVGLFFSLLARLGRFSKQSHQSNSTAMSPTVRLAGSSQPNPTTSDHWTRTDLNKSIDTADEQGVVGRSISRVIDRMQSERKWLRTRLTYDIPCWLGEQLELITESPVSVQRLATIASVFAILFAWIVLNSSR